MAIIIDEVIFQISRDFNEVKDELSDDLRFGAVPRNWFPDENSRVDFDGIIVTTNEKTRKTLKKILKRKNILYTTDQYLEGRPMWMQDLWDELRGLENDPYR